MSGKSNVIYWLEKRGIQPTEARVEKIFARAKLADRLLTDAEILRLCGLPAAAGRPRGERRKGGHWSPRRLPSQASAGVAY